MALWLRWPEPALRPIALSASPTAAARTRSGEPLPAMLTVTVVNTVPRSRPAAAAAIVATEIPVSTAANRELRQRPRVLLPFRARKCRSNQLTMDRSFLGLRLAVVIRRGWQRLVVDMTLRFTLRRHDGVRRFRRVRGIVSVFV
jgi:hypothetical protein